MNAHCCMRETMILLTARESLQVRGSLERTNERAQTSESLHRDFIARLFSFDHRSIGYVARLCARRLL